MDRIAGTDCMDRRAVAAAGYKDLRSVGGKMAEHTVVGTIDCVAELQGHNGEDNRRTGCRDDQASVDERVHKSSRVHSNLLVVAIGHNQVCLFAEDRKDSDGLLNSRKDIVLDSRGTGTAVSAVVHKGRKRSLQSCGDHKSSDCSKKVSGGSGLTAEDSSLTAEDRIAVAYRDIGLID